MQSKEQQSRSRTREILIFDNEKEVIDFCIAHFLNEAQSALDLEDSFTVALSGGSTPKKFFDLLSKSEEALELNWKKIALFWSDERAVAPDHPDSNYAMAMQYFGKSPFNQAKIFRMEAERPDRDAAAKEYEQLIRTHCKEGRFDLVYLGLGEDGHTASLFPESQALSIKDRLVAANYVEAKKSWRMTLTYPCINKARNVVVVALGAAKANMIKKIFDNGSKEILPAALVGTVESPALFICDMAAAPDFATD